MHHYITIILISRLHVQCTFDIKKEADRKQYDGPPKDLIHPVEQAVSLSSLVGECNGNTHDANEPGSTTVRPFHLLWLKNQ